MKVILDTKQLDDVARNTIKGLEATIRKQEAQINRLKDRIELLQRRLNNVEEDKLEITNIKGLAKKLVDKLFDKRWLTTDEMGRSKIDQ